MASVKIASDKIAIRAKQRVAKIAIFCVKQIETRLRFHKVALKVVFEGINIWGCLFHLGQNSYRKIVEIGYKGMYSNDNEFRELAGCFPALSVLPIEDVTEVFEVLIDEDIDE